MSFQDYYRLGEMLRQHPPPPVIADAILRCLRQPPPGQSTPSDQPQQTQGET